MITIYDSQKMAIFLSGSIDPNLKTILLDRLELLAGFSEWDLADLAHFIIVQPGDCIDAVETELGISPFVNLVDGARYPDSRFEPNWEHCIVHKGYFDLTFALCDAGLAICLLVPDRDDIEPQLLELCRVFGTK